jgi:hypothetical protein
MFRTCMRRSTARRGWQSGRASETRMVHPRHRNHRRHCRRFLGAIPTSCVKTSSAQKKYSDAYLSLSAAATRVSMLFLLPVLRGEGGRRPDEGPAAVTVATKHSLLLRHEAQRRTQPCKRVAGKTSDRKSCPARIRRAGARPTRKFRSVQGVLQHADLCGLQALRDRPKICFS